MKQLALNLSILALIDVFLLILGADAVLNGLNKTNSLSIALLLIMAYVPFKRAYMELKGSVVEYYTYDDMDNYDDMGDEEY